MVASVIGLALTGLLFEPSLAKGVAIGIDLGLFATLPSPTYACTTSPTVHPLSPSTRTPLHSLSHSPLTDCLVPNPPLPTQHRLWVTRSWPPTAAFSMTPMRRISSFICTSATRLIHPCLIAMKNTCLLAKF